MSNSPPLASSSSSSNTRAQDDDVEQVEAASVGEWARAYNSRKTSYSSSPDLFSLLSQSFLLFIKSAVVKAWRSELEREDLPGLINNARSYVIGPQLQTQWEIEKKKHKNPRLARALFRISSVKWVTGLGVLATSIQGVIGAVARPVVLRYMVLRAGQGESLQVGEIVGLVFAFAIVSFTEGWLGVIGRQLVSESLGTEFQNSANYLIYNKMQTVATPSKQETNFMGNDLVRAYFNLRSAASLPMAITGCIGGIIYLLFLVGVTGLVGVGVMVLILLLNIYIGRLTHAVELKSLKAADTRLEILSSIFEGSRAVKLFSWEDKFSEKVLKARDEEMKHVRLYRIMQVTNIVTGRASPVLSSMATLVVFVASGYNLDASVAFATVSVFQALRLGLIMVPLAVSSLAAMDATCVRIESFLLREDQSPPNVYGPNSNDGLLLDISNVDLGYESQAPLSNEKTVKPAAVASQKPASQQPAGSFAIGLQGEKTLSGKTSLSAAIRRISQESTPRGSGEFEHINESESSDGNLVPASLILPNEIALEEQPTQGQRIDGKVLSSINLQVAPGKVVAICGTVGSGKSTLVSCIIQALKPKNPTNGHCKVTPSIGYSPQYSFVISGTIRENILLGRKYSKDLFDEALRVSSLIHDLDLFDKRENTEVGERGTTLSGGQAQRLCVARAVYGKPKLLVLDDPLAAVDARVSHNMFEQAVLGYVVEPDGTKTNERSCIIVMNQLAYIHRCDWIVYLSEGALCQQGTFNDLMSSNGPFAAFFRAGLQEQSQETPRDPIQAANNMSDKESSLKSPKQGASNEQPNQDAQENKNSTTQTQNGEEKDKLSSFAQVKETNSNNLPASTLEKPNGEAKSFLGAEFKEKGAIKNKVYLSYLKGMGIGFTILSMMICILGYACMALTDFWLSYWTKQMGLNGNINQNYYVSVYAGLSIAFTVLIMLTSYMLCFGGVRASVAIHANMMHKILNAPMNWIEVQTLGKILSRFGGDLSRVDTALALSVDNAAQVTIMLIVLVIVICVIIPYLTIVAVVAILFYSITIMATDRAMRDAKRINNNAMSPLISNSSEAIRGRAVLQAFGADTKRFFFVRHCLASDEFSRSTFASGTVIWFGYLLNHIQSFILSVIAAVMLVVLRNSFDPSIFALSLSYAFQLPYFASMSSQVIIQTSFAFLSLERLLEYEDLPQEKPHHLPNDPQAEEWPTKGEISFENVTLRYREGLPYALKGITFKIDAGISVGIVGRTGAGKSSIISVLFRLTEVTSGRILIDGIDISTLGLAALRSRLTIIPQDPILMMGSLRTNLDPFNERSDAELYDALKKAKLGGIDLNQHVSKGGSNWSSGERQLICLSRALLDRKRILVMDEPTSNVDMVTDEMVQEVILNEFVKNGEKRTTITIAHRLESVIMCNKVLVLKDGNIAEYKSPYELMNKQGEFSSMVNALGQKSSKRLLKKAETSYRASESSANIFNIQP